MNIIGLSSSDELLLTIEEVNESFVPSRCPSCESTDIIDATCVRGSVCGEDCGGGGFYVSCATCGITINESQCEEVEEE